NVWNILLSDSPHSHPSFGPPRSSKRMVSRSTALTFTMILYGVLGFRFNSKMRIKADAIAAIMMGKGVFLSALEKIGRAFPSIMTRGRPSLAYPPGRPIVEKRIG